MNIDCSKLCSHGGQNCGPGFSRCGRRLPRKNSFAIRSIDDVVDRGELCVGEVTFGVTTVILATLTAPDLLLRFTGSVCGGGMMSSGGIVSWCKCERRIFVTGEWREVPSGGRF